MPADWSLLNWYLVTVILTPWRGPRIKALELIGKRHELFTERR
jgi:hypothetical protein